MVVGVGVCAGMHVGWCEWVMRVWVVVVWVLVWLCMVVWWSGGVGSGAGLGHGVVVRVGDTGCGVAVGAVMCGGGNGVSG